MTTLKEAVRIVESVDTSDLVKKANEQEVLVAGRSWTFDKLTIVDEMLVATFKHNCRCGDTHHLSLTLDDDLNVLTYYVED